MGIFEKGFFSGKSKQAEKHELPKEKNEELKSSVKKEISRRDFLKLAGAGTFLAGSAYLNNKVEKTGAKLYDFSEREAEKREMARALPAKIIEKEDFPMNTEKISQYLDLINQISIENTTYTDKKGKVDPGYNLISIDMRDFKKVFFSDSFQNILKSRAGAMSYMNAFSLAQATFRTLERRGKILSQSQEEYYDKSANDDNDDFKKDKEFWEEILKRNDSLLMSEIEKVTRDILENIDRVKGRELFGPNTNLILFCHEEPYFNNEAIIDKLYSYFGGKAEKILANEKGVSKCKKMTVRMLMADWNKQHPELEPKRAYLQEILSGESDKNLSKIKTLYAIASCQGPTTILFSGHGGPNCWSFAENQADNIKRGIELSEQDINYMEIGDALIASGNIENVNLIGAACRSYDFLQNLFSYLESRGINEKPCISISATNESRYGWVTERKNKLEDDLLYAMEQRASSSKSQTLTAKHFFMAEGDVWEKEDPAILIGWSENEGLSQKEFSFNDYNSGNLQKKEGEKNEEDVGWERVYYDGEYRLIPANKQSHSEQFSYPAAQNYLELGAVKNRNIGAEPRYFA